MSSHSFQLTKEPKLFVPVGLVSPVTGSQEVIGDKISYFPAQPFSSREVEAEMLSSEDTAQGRFFGGGRKARKRAFDSGENFRGYVEIEMVPLEKGNQHLRPGSA